MKQSTDRKNRIGRSLGALLAALVVLMGVVSFAMPARAADPLTGTLPVSQQLITTKIPDNAVFTYELKRSPSTPYAPLPEGSSGDIYSFTITGNNTETVLQTLSIVYPTTGEHEYTLRCVDCSESWRFNIDPEVYAVKAFAYGNKADILVYTMPAQGQMEGDKVDPESNPLFIHTRTDNGEPDPLVAVDPPVKKRITGTPQNKDAFRFRLRSEEDGNPMPAGSANGEKIIEIRGEGEAEFGEWIYTQPGTYNYDISEVNTNDPNYKYDTIMYTITDVVTLVESGQTVELHVNRSIEDSNGKPVASTLITPATNNERSLPLEFTNEYTGSGGKDNGGGGSSGGRSSTGKASSVKTGDENRPAIWIAAIVSAAAVLILVLLLLITRRHQDRNDPR